MWKPITRFLASEDGPTAVEYAVLLALIIVAALTAIGTVGTETSGLLDSVNSDIQSAIGP